MTAVVLSLPLSERRCSKAEVEVELGAGVGVAALRLSAEHQFELDHRHRFLDSFLRVIVYSMHSVGAEGVGCVGRMNENEIR